MTHIEKRREKRRKGERGRERKETERRRGHAGRASKTYSYRYRGLEREMDRSSKKHIQTKAEGKRQTGMRDAA